MLGNTFSCYSIFISLHLTSSFILFHAIIIEIIFPLLTPLNNATHLEHDFIIFVCVVKNFIMNFSSFAGKNNFHTFFKENSSHFTALMLTLNLSSVSMKSNDVSHPNKSEIHGELIEKKTSQRRKVKLTKHSVRKSVTAERTFTLLHTTHHSIRTQVLQIIVWYFQQVSICCLVNMRTSQTLCKLSLFSEDEMRFWE